MADLVVTYSRSITRAEQHTPPVAAGSAARTEAIAIGGASATGALSAAAGEDLVELLAGAACWVAIGADPTAAANTGRKLLADDRVAYRVAEGETVAVIEAA